VETSFPDRYYVLKKNLLIEILIIIVIFAAAIGCEPTKELTVEPVPVFSKILNIDSTYTEVSVIPTGNSSLLFCGEKDNFNSYSILKFDSLPESFDSLFLQLQSDSAAVELTLYELKEEWSENSVFLWDSIGNLIDTLDPIVIQAVNDSNPRIFIGSSYTLDYSVIENIGNFGLAVHSDPFYSFNAEETRLQLDTVSGDTLVNSSVWCMEDAFIVKNPFRDSLFSDSLLVGRGISVRTHIIIPRDSLPEGLNSIASAKLFFDVDTAFSFNVETTSQNSGIILYPGYTEDYDSMRIDLARLFQRVGNDSVVDVQIRASNEIGGIGYEKFGGGLIKFVWVEFPR
jgi:hypothetical protein